MNKDYRMFHNLIIFCYTWCSKRIIWKKLERRAGAGAGSGLIVFLFVVDEQITEDDNDDNDDIYIFVIC